VKFRLLKSHKILILLFSFLLVFSTGYGLGQYVGHRQAFDPVTVTLRREVPSSKNLDFSLFWQIWDSLEESYYDQSKLVPSEMVYGAIKGMVGSLGDPYTTFLTPRENIVVQEDLNGNFEGIGIQIGFRATQLAVIAPLPGSPAEAVGIKSGDYIIGIKDDSKDIDKSTVGISLPQAVQDIRGPAGTAVTLALLRDGSDEPIFIDVQRASIDVPSLILTFAGDNDTIAHIKLLKFGSETVSEWDQAVLEIQKKDNLSGIIIDLRNNTGGYLQAAVDIASEFIDTGKVIVIEERASGDHTNFLAERPARLAKEKVVLLVNQGSASASEILAGALRDQNQIPIVGQVTFGKGTIQEPRPVEGGGGLHITTARWLTPNETWVNGTGLEPDVIIEDDSKTTPDEQLQKAIELLASSKN
jgi:carboxyl-terminal processing protease